MSDPEIGPENVPRIDLRFGARPARPTEISERMKDLIVENGLQPGDRCRRSATLMTHFKASKSTIREALGALQAEGLVKTRTGPGGGAFVSAIDAIGRWSCSAITSSSSSRASGHLRAAQAARAGNGGQRSRPS
jgi:DNA-binding FadR family transcriptional regulator